MKTDTKSGGFGGGYEMPKPITKAGLYGATVSQPASSRAAKKTQSHYRKEGRTQRQLRTAKASNHAGMTRHSIDCNNAWRNYTAKEWALCLLMALTLSGILPCALAGALIEFFEWLNLGIFELPIVLVMLIAAGWLFIREAVTGGCDEYR